MITTTLFSEKEIYDKKNKSKIFSDEILGTNFQPTDVAICTGVETSGFYLICRQEKRVSYCFIHTEEKLNSTGFRSMKDDCELGLYPCFRFSDVSELVKELGVKELKDYKSGIKIGIVYIPTKGKSRKENKELLKKIENGELREIDVKDAFFPTNKCNSLRDRLDGRFGIKENKYYVDQNGRIFLKIEVNPVYDKDRDSQCRMCELNNGAGYVPYEEEIVAEVEPVYICIDPEQHVAALEVVPVSGIGGKNAIEEYLSLLTKCIGDLQIIVQREKEKIEEIEREIMERQIAEDKIFIDKLNKMIEKLNRPRGKERQGDNNIMKSGDEIEGRD